MIYVGFTGAVRKDVAEIPRVHYFLRGSLTSSLLINSVERAATFNVIKQPRCTVLLACYLDRIAQILRFRVMISVSVRQTVPEL